MRKLTMLFACTFLLGALALPVRAGAVAVCGVGFDGTSSRFGAEPCACTAGAAAGDGANVGAGVSVGAGTRAGASAGAGAISGGAF